MAVLHPIPFLRSFSLAFDWIVGARAFPGMVYQTRTAWYVLVLFRGISNTNIVHTTLETIFHSLHLIFRCMLTLANLSDMNQCVINDIRIYECTYFKRRVYRVEHFGNLLSLWYIEWVIQRSIFWKVNRIGKMYETQGYKNLRYSLWYWNADHKLR